jgi:hypothetical protein
MTMRKRWTALAHAGAAVLLLSVPAGAQEVDFGSPSPTRWQVSGGFILAQPVGEFNRYVGAGYGAAAQVQYALDRLGIVSVRGEAGVVTYGRETRRVCFSGTVGCRILVDLTTSNDIIFLNLGPHLELPLGPIRPFVNLGMGGSHFATTSTLKNISNQEDIASTTNFADGTLAWTGGGGLNVMLGSGPRAVGVHLGARYHGNGSVQYLREGDIEDHEDGSVTYSPTRSEANLVAYQLGVTVRLGRSR